MQPLFIKLLDMVQLVSLAPIVCGVSCIIEPNRDMRNGGAKVTKNFFDHK